MITFSALREAPMPDGSPGPFSIRRCLAAYFAALSAVLFVEAVPHLATSWTAAIPGAVCVVAVLFLLFFTTWADVAAAVRKVINKGA